MLKIYTVQGWIKVLGVFCLFLYETFRLKRVNNENICVQMKNTTKNLVLYGKAFGPSGSGQITWDFQTGPFMEWKI